MINSIYQTNNLFFVYENENLINWLFLKKNKEGDSIFCEYEYTFKEFKSIAEQNTISFVFYDNLSRIGKHTEFSESDERFEEYMAFIKEGYHDFEGATDETINGILKRIKEIEAPITIENFRPLLPEEQKYAFMQPTLLEEKTGCLAHIRADFGASGNSFFSLFDDHNNIITKYYEPFREEFYRIIHDLRFSDKYQNLLYNRECMKDFCNKNKDALFLNKDKANFGFRVDTKDYSYFLRCNPEIGEYNLYCYAYTKSVINEHIQNAEKGIHFLSANSKMNFQIKDGDKIRINLAEGKYKESICRYYDDSYVLFDKDLIQIKELVLLIERTGSSHEAAKNSLSSLIRTASRSKEISGIKSAENKNKFM